MIGPLRRIVPKVIRRSYVLKFGITLLIIGVVIGAIGFVATGQMESEIRQGVNQDLSNLAAQEAGSFSSWDERNQLVVNSLSTANVLSGGGVYGESQEYVTEQINRSSVTPDGASIHYLDHIDGEWTFLATTGDDATPGRELQGEPIGESTDAWVTELEGQTPDDFPAEQRVQVLDTYSNGGPRLAYVSPTVRRGDPTNSTLVVYVVKLDGYQGGVGTPGSVTYILDDDQIVFDSTGKQDLQQYPGEHGVVLDRLGAMDTENATGDNVVELGQPSGALAVSAENFTDENYVASYSRVNDTPYSVVVHTPESEAYGFVTTVTQSGRFATLAGLIVIGVIGAILGRNTAVAIDRLRKKSEDLGKGNLDVEFETQRIDNVGRLYDSMATMRDRLSEQINEAREARQEAERARQEAERTSQHLQSKAQEYSDVMQACAAGDLRERMDPSDRSEAMSEIAGEFNEMIGEIERTVTQLKDFANEVATSSEEVTASAEEVRSASQQVTRSIQEISEGAERQNDSLQSVSSEMSGLSTTVEEIASLSNEVADLSEQTAETGRRGREAAQEAVAGMNQIEVGSEEAVEQIERLNEEMAQIDDLIEFITDVANQTNMLALNANIEASRAGSGEGDSEGFAVVANEVKELAEETKDAAEDIEERLERIRAQSDRTVQEVRQTGDRISENTESIRNAVQALDEIAGYAEETNTGVQEISAATEQQAASTQQVVAMVDEAATISERTTQESENVAAAAEEQTSAMTEVSNSASDLSEQANRLSEALDRFDTGDVEPISEMGAEPSEEVLGDAGAVEEGLGDPTADLDADVSEPVEEIAEELDAEALEDERGQPDDGAAADEPKVELDEPDLEAAAEDIGDSTADPPAGIGEIADDDLPEGPTDDGDTLGGTEPATFDEAGETDDAEPDDEPEADAGDAEIDKDADD